MRTSSLFPSVEFAFSSLPGLFYSSCDNSGSAPISVGFRGVRYGELYSHATGAKTLVGFSDCTCGISSTPALHAMQALFLGFLILWGSNASKAALIVKRVLDPFYNENFGYWPTFAHSILLIVCVQTINSTDPCNHKPPPCGVLWMTLLDSLLFSSKTKGFYHLN